MRIICTTHDSTLATFEESGGLQSLNDHTKLVE
jgi:hypothetical protein